MSNNIKNHFTRFSPATAEAERALKSWKIKYTKTHDGKMLIVEGDIDISGKGLKKLPDLSCVIVTGSFNCDRNFLETLKGSPNIVGKNFRCALNNLADLKGSPKSVGGIFDCCMNPNLKNFVDVPTSFAQLCSDLGNFSSWNSIPLHLKQAIGNGTKLGKPGFKKR